MSIIRKVEEVLSGNRQKKPVCIAELAAALSLSPSRIGHQVAELFGMSFPKLVNQVRLEQATLSLRAEDVPVGEIARR
ncbi:MAG: helix-turn-helix domain-containing protein, partial [Planctomycetota bacterium]